MLRFSAVDHHGNGEYIGLIITSVD